MTALSLAQQSPGRWVARAACSSRPDLSWFPEQHPSSTYRARVDAAKAVCKGCPVKDECLAHAVEVDEIFGIWGGLDEAERGHSRRRLTQPQCAVEGCTTRVSAKGFCHTHYIRWWRTGSPLRHPHAAHPDHIRSYRVGVR